MLVCMSILAFSPYQHILKTSDMFWQEQVEQAYLVSEREDLEFSTNWLTPHGINTQTVFEWIDPAGHASFRIVAGRRGARGGPFPRGASCGLARSAGCWGFGFGKWRKKKRIQLQQTSIRAVDFDIFPLIWFCPLHFYFFSSWKYFKVEECSRKTDALRSFFDSCPTQRADVDAVGWKLVGNQFWM